MSESMTAEQFVLAYIKANEKVSAEGGKKNKDGKPYAGAHVVYSGLNEELRERFNVDPIETIDAMDKAGIIIKRGARGGPIVYTPDNVPAEGKGKTRASVLAAMGI